MGFLRVYINTDIRVVRLEKFVIAMIKQLIITITKFSNLIGCQLPVALISALIEQFHRAVRVMPK